MDKEQDISTAPKSKSHTFGENDLSKYLLSTPKDIGRAFHELIFTKETITVRAGDNDTAMLTTMVDILPDKGLFIFDKSQSQKINEKIENAKHLFFEAHPNQIAIRFSTTKAKSARYLDESIFIAPIPEHFYRVQRREFFRIDTPTVPPITCQIPGSNGLQFYELFDISIGGIGINDPDGKIDNSLAVFDTIEHCILHLPKFGDIKIDLEVRTIYEKYLMGETVRHFGLAFKELSDTHTTAVQQYINRRQLKKRAQELDLD